MPEKLLTLNSPDTGEVTLEPNTLKALSATDFGKVSLVVARPLLVIAVDALAKTDALDDLELTEAQKQVIVDKFLEIVDGIIGKVK